MRGDHRSEESVSGMRMLPAAGVAAVFGPSITPSIPDRITSAESKVTNARARTARCRCEGPVETRTGLPKGRREEPSAIKEFLAQYLSDGEHELHGHVHPSRG